MIPIFFFNFFIISNNFKPPLISPDGDSYISISKFFKGETKDFNKLRISRPIVPLLIIPFSYFFPYKISYLILNSILFILLVFVFYLVSSYLLDNQIYSFYSALLLIFSFPVYYRGINVTVDLACWLVYTSVLLIILYLELNNKFNLKYICMVAILCAFGTLATEVVLAAFLFVFIYYIFNTIKKDKKWIDLLFDLFIIGICFSLPVILFQFEIYYFFNYTIFDKAVYQAEWKLNNPLNFGPIGTLRVFIGAFSISIIFALFGLFDFIKDNKNKYFYFSIFLSSLMTFLVISVNSIRFVFIMFPLVFIFAIKGIDHITKNIQRWFSLSIRKKNILFVLSIIFIVFFNFLLYFSFIRYGSTTALAEKFLKFLL